MDDDDVRIGGVYIDVWLTDDGKIEYTFDVEGINHAEAIGRLRTVAGVLEEQERADTLLADDDEDED